MPRSTIGWSGGGSTVSPLRPGPGKIALDRFAAQP
jgi:hypothetical protein